MVENAINFIQETYETKEFIPSHGSRFIDKKTNT